MKLSIIIPCYNAEPYIHELLDCLDKQMTEDIQVIVIDDGSKKEFKTKYKWCQVVRQANGGASAARNKGLDLAEGEYVSFIDADDLVADNYISKILETIVEDPDYIYLSWRTLPGGWNCDVKLNKISDTFPSFNLCVWNRVYKRSLIGKVRFNTSKLIAEDAEFIRAVKEKGKKAIISDYMYFYRSNTPDSLTKRFASGQLETERIVYYFKHVTSDMKYLVEEFKKADKYAEVILLSEQNDIPELSRYAMIMKPCTVKATEARGEHTNLIHIIKRPKRTQIVIWTAKTFNIGGIETFIYAFCRNMAQYYDIIVLYEVMDPAQIGRLQQYVEVIKHSADTNIKCDTLIINRITDDVPDGVKADRVVQMVHGCRLENYSVPDREIVVSVSNAVKDSWNLDKSQVIHNMTYIDKPKSRPLLLVSATRLDFANKGGDRMVKLADLMRKQGIEFVWLYFSNRELKHAPEGMIRMMPTLDILKYIKMADYLVQLSDTEAFCYSIVEALEVGTPVIMTPLPVMKELNIQDGVHGYVVPFDVDTDTTRFLDVPTVEYKYDNAPIIKQWRKLLGNTKPVHSYDPSRRVSIRIRTAYLDTEYNRTMEPGEVVSVPSYRAKLIIEKGYAEYFNTIS